jgi:hypothetical protein
VTHTSRHPNSYRYVNMCESTSVLVVIVSLYEWRTSSVIVFSLRLTQARLDATLLIFCCDCYDSSMTVLTDIPQENDSDSSNSEPTTSTRSARQMTLTLSAYQFIIAHSVIWRAQNGKWKTKTDARCIFLFHKFPVSILQILIAS